MEIKSPISKQPIPAHAQCVFKGKLFDVYQWEQVMFDGTTKTFEKVKRPDTAIILPVLDNGNILLIKEEQPGKTSSYITACGGRIDEGEDILKAAKRELLEETGYEASEFILWKAICPSQKIDYVGYYFIAKGCRKIFDQSLDGGEKVDIKEVSFDEFLQIARKQRFMEKELIADLYEALLDQEQYLKIKELFAPLDQ